MTRLVRQSTSGPKRLIPLHPIKHAEWRTIAGRRVKVEETYGFTEADEEAYELYNPYHDRQGRFTGGTGIGAAVSIHDVRARMVAGANAAKVAGGFWQEDAHVYAPASMSKEEFAARTPAGYEYGGKRGGGIVATRLVGENKTRLYDEFFEMDESARRYTLDHEVGHSVGVPILAAHSRNWQKIYEPFRTDRGQTPSPTTRSRYDTGGGADNIEETIGHNFAELRANAARYTENPDRRAVYNFVARSAERSGYLSRKQRQELTRTPEGLI